MNAQFWLQFAGITAAASPLVLVLLLGLPGLLRRFPREEIATGLIQTATTTGFVASTSLLGIMLTTGLTEVTIDLGDWVSIPHYHLHFRLLFDRLSVPFVILTFLLCGVISAFAARYLHREAGHQRFQMAYALFVLGMTLATAAGTIETLFIGWEFVGLSSALLVAFYQERLGPLTNGLRIWAIYRISDAALVLAAIALHHVQGEGRFSLAFGSNWPDGTTLLTDQQCLVVGLLILVAAAGKSALVPFSGWLPRAMEGPTPSSAIFYGALSVHLGAFLLLRISPLLDRVPLLAGTVVVLGLLTTAYASLVVRVQTDVKSALSFASLIQVGLIVAEIGLGLRYLALVHILSHACLRTLQFLRAPSILQDRRGLENALGRRLSASEIDAALEVVSPKTLAQYRWALERGYLDVCLDRGIVQPITGLFRWCDRQERRWVAFLQGPSLATRPQKEDPPHSYSPAAEEHA